MSPTIAMSLVWLFASGAAAWMRWGRRGWETYLRPPSVDDCIKDAVTMELIVLGLLPWWDHNGLTWELIGVPWLAAAGTMLPMILSLVVAGAYVSMGAELRRELAEGEGANGGQEPEEMDAMDMEEAQRQERLFEAFRGKREGVGRE
jgi:hypothetical protein